jgi:type IV pilus assembly protein PilE
MSCPVHIQSSIRRSPAKPLPGQNLRKRAASGGFTLVELMLVVVIMGVLLAVAFPSYIDSVRKGRRAEGIAALTALQQAQERFRANKSAYGNLNVPADAATLNDAPRLSKSANERYTLEVDDLTGTTYTLTATATGAQASDTACVKLGVKANGGNLRYGSGTTNIDWAAVDADAGKCWAK